MSCNACENGTASQVDNALLARVNQAGCEADQLTSLMEVLGDHLEQAPERIDPLRSVRLAADIARIARGLSARLTGRMMSAEEVLALRFEAGAGPPE